MIWSSKTWNFYISFKYWFKQLMLNKKDQIFQISFHVCERTCSFLPWIRRLELIKIYHLFQGYFIPYFFSVFIELLPLLVPEKEPCILFEGAKYTHLVNICIISFWRYHQTRNKKRYVYWWKLLHFMLHTMLRLWIKHKGGQQPRKKGM